GELAPALPRVVESPQSWLDTVERRLALLKGAVHRGLPLPGGLLWPPLTPRALCERAILLATEEPRLCSLLNLLSCVDAGHPARLGSALDLILSWGPGCELLTSRLGEETAPLTLLRLAALAVEHGRERVQPLLAALFDEGCHDTALSQGGEVCTQIVSGI